MYEEDWFSVLHGPGEMWRTIDWTEIHNVRNVNFTFMLCLFLCLYTSESWRVMWVKSHLRAQWKWQRMRWAWGHRWRCRSGKLLWTWGCPRWPAGGCTDTLPRCTATTLLHREQAGLGKACTYDRAGEETWVTDRWSVEDGRGRLGGGWGTANMGEQGQMERKARP